ncbi:hypothetical protein BU24DRAFT_405462 [Aaosphaeria arxii CBS 175.79]|uniref:Uncharacterized protein n=1 Tax=Aaosphaeria arxii CBS 175.79 TaxID=1450172 RepID=A0A6A5Y0I4_9PLEO|nr:uncharacterized protein BU24DRAFT_405462 [Aaosphaeria arxii CBS 175.79]KAF2018703.1 hypothetical protein BU24DRAFT_405462 [Aaosphaeria arxii CBS 175.79]
MVVVRERDKREEAAQGKGKRKRQEELGKKRFKGSNQSISSKLFGRIDDYWGEVIGSKETTTTTTIIHDMLDAGCWMLAAGWHCWGWFYGGLDWHNWLEGTEYFRETNAKHALDRAASRFNMHHVMRQRNLEHSAQLSCNYCTWVHAYEGNRR